MLSKYRYQQTTLRNLADTYSIAGSTGFALAIPQARRLLWAPRTRTMHSGCNTLDHGGDGDGDGNCSNTTTTAATTTTTTNTTATFRNNAANCLTAWDFYHRNFSTGRACRDCAMGSFSTNNDVAFIDSIVNAAVDSGAVDPTRVYLSGQWKCTHAQLRPVCTPTFAPCQDEIITFATSIGRHRYARIYTPEYYLFGDRRQLFEPIRPGDDAGSQVHSADVQAVSP